MKKRFLQKALILFLAFTTNSSIAQKGLPKWVFPNDTTLTNSSKELDLSSGSFSNLPMPTGQFSYLDYQGQVPTRVFNNFTDDSGNLQFFMMDIDNKIKIFDHEGYLIGMISSAVINNSTTPNSNDLKSLFVGSNVGIINVPGECNKYYIIIYNSNDYRGYYYVTLDMDAPSIFHSNRYGSVTSDHIIGGIPGSVGWFNELEEFVARPIRQSNFVLSNPNENWDGHQVSFTNIKNSERYMYLSGKSNIERFRVTNQGFIDDNYDLNTYFNIPSTAPYHFELLNTTGGMGTMTDADIVKLQSGNYKIAIPMRPGSAGSYSQLGLPTWGSGSDYVYCMVATIDGNTGNFIDHLGIKLPKNSTVAMSGIEFSKNGDYLYLASNIGSKLYYADLNQSATNNYISATPLNVTNAGDFQFGNIERGLNDKLYFAKANGIGTLSNSNDPTSTWNSNAYSINIPERLPSSSRISDQGYILPQGLNNENYDHTNALELSIYIRDRGPFCVGQRVTVGIALETGSLPQGVWSNGETGSTIQYTIEQGTNTISYYTFNEFGCPETVTTSFVVNPNVQVALNTTQNAICPANGPTVLSYEVSFQSSTNEGYSVLWTKDGSFYSNSTSPIQITEPGEYCIEITEFEQGCTSEKVCITILPGDCMNLDPSFNFVKNVGASSYTIDVVANDTRPCASRGWYVVDINGNILSTDWFVSGRLSFTFQLGETYDIAHGLWSDCQTYIASTRTVSQINRLKTPGQSNEEEGYKALAYPNPSTGIFKVSFTKEVFQTLTVRNIIGEVIKELPIDNSDIQQLEIDLSDYSSGIYFISLRGNNSIETIKITKQ